METTHKKWGGSLSSCHVGLTWCEMETKQHFATFQRCTRHCLNKQLCVSRGNNPPRSHPSESLAACRLPLDPRPAGQEAMRSQLTQLRTAYLKEPRIFLAGFMTIRAGQPVGSKFGLVGIRSGGELPKLISTTKSKGRAPGLSHAWQRFMLF